MHTNFFVPVCNVVFAWNQHLDLATIDTHTLADYRYLQFGWEYFAVEIPSWEKTRLARAVRP